MDGRWKAFTASLQIKDSLLSGFKMTVPVVGLWILYSVVGGGLASLWSNIFAFVGGKNYFPSHGTGLFLTVLMFYLAGRIPRTHVFMLSAGRIFVKIPRIGPWYQNSVKRMFMKSGFLTPVWVYHNGQLAFDALGNVEKISYGRRRRAYFLREVIDSNPDLPPALLKTCELMMATPSVIGGIVELFPFPLVAIQVKPDSEKFGWALMTSGFAGYENMKTLNWEKARENSAVLEIPEKKRRVLLKLGIAVPSDSSS